ncbi:prenyltransferase/squalene oxidase repeat-containing protein [Paenibacillus sp. FSL W8-1187]|uniref:Squalene--hopene cyclase n=1 Tax=Paenibacillus pasadenensis TaxID=217090 RepID=A0A2N5N9Z7_9BACL|nr:prenyltransferase/squalene oxidase repeat-containing protein [Paenibacillus pasadenensis]PLT47110.1 Squalene--hopene cyclase [Paenibacillus pasadenensis]
MSDPARLASAAISRLQQELLRSQSGDGAWRMICESGVMSDAYLLILLQALGRPPQDEELIRRIAARIASLQHEDGGWRLHADQREGHLESSVEAYYALLASGALEYGDPALVHARRFILERGGLTRVRAMMTQVLLAMTGQLPWPKELRLPVEALLAPSWLPLSLFDLSGHARAHLVPVLMLSSGSFRLGEGRLPQLTELIAGEDRGFSLPTLLPEPLAGMLQAMADGHTPLYPASLERAERYLLERIEPNGTLLTYSTATMLMVAALLSIGYDPGDETIRRALDGVRSLVWQEPEEAEAVEIAAAAAATGTASAPPEHAAAGPAPQPERAHLQIADSALWDTAMIANALLESGMPPEADAIQRAARWVAARQQSEAGDWRRRVPGVKPGGWGFSAVNTRYPDVDDTTAALLLLQRAAGKSGGAPYWSEAAQERGSRWAWALQNRSGGWPAFERESGSPLIGLIQFEQSAQIVTDPPTVDLTARTLQWAALASAPLPGWLAAALQAEDDDAETAAAAAAVRRACAWIVSQQDRDGSWAGRWGICRVHGTGAALAGLLAVKAPRSASALYRGMQWLLSVQNGDGGWGESCASDVEGKYVPLGASTPCQTAWALEGLLAHPHAPREAVERGIACLCALLEADDWRGRYPAGGGLPGHVYLHYGSSRYIWPLRVLAQYVRRYGGGMPAEG